MFIKFGGSLISISNIFGFKKCEKVSVLSEYYSIEMIFNHDNSDGYSCWEEFETKEEMEKRWNELKMLLCPMKTLSCDDTVKLDKDGNPFFIHVDLANGNPV